MGRAPVHAAETRRLYQADWDAFEDWCGVTGHAALPAEPAALAAFLREASAQLSAGALARRASAIATRHRRDGLASPAADQAVKAILRHARAAATPRRVAPPKSSDIVRMATRCPGDLAGTRDRALLLLAAQGLDRASLVGLQYEQLRFEAKHLVILPQGRQAERRIVQPGRARMTCPVLALQDWLEVSQTTYGPVFRKIDRWGNIEYQPLGTDAVRRILTRRGLRPRRSRPRKPRPDRKAAVP